MTEQDGIEPAFFSCPECGGDLAVGGHMPGCVRLAPEFAGAGVLPLTLDDRMLGRHGPHTPEQEADLQRYYDHHYCLIDEAIKTARAELLGNLSTAAPDIDWYSVLENQS